MSGCSADTPAVTMRVSNSFHAEATVGHCVDPLTQVLTFFQRFAYPDHVRDIGAVSLDS